MLRGLSETVSSGRDCGRRLRSLDVPGLSVRETLYAADGVVPTAPNARATLCLVLEGGYRVDGGRTGLDCGPASLVFHAPGQAYRERISEAGSHCLTVDVDPAALTSAADDLPDFEGLDFERPDLERLDLERLGALRRAPPHWLAFQLRQELALQDASSAVSVESTVLALLAELADRSGLEAGSGSPPWLWRVQERIDDEFHRHSTLESLAETAGVHRVHLAREFRRRFGCTVGHYIRQRRVEHACHRLVASCDALAEIASDAGFADQSHFTNTFRRLVGLSPGVFRARFATSSSAHAARAER